MISSKKQTWCFCHQNPVLIPLLLLIFTQYFDCMLDWPSRYQPTWSRVDLLNLRWSFDLWLPLWTGPPASLELVNSLPMSLGLAAVIYSLCPHYKKHCRVERWLSLLNRGINCGMMVSGIPAGAESKLYHRHKGESWPLITAQPYILLLSYETHPILVIFI